MSETATDEAPHAIYLAIGIPQGLVFVSDQSDQSEEPFFYIRLGGETIQVPLTSYEWWGLALDGVGVDAIRDWAAKRNDLDDFSDNLACLVEYNLLLPWTSDVGDIEQFPKIRVVPAGMGVGNSHDNPHEFVILSRREGAPVLRLDFLAYVIWSFFDGVISLEQACQSTADHLQLPVDSVRQRALTLVPTLMRNGLALLDVVYPS
jgi:hypothetical protein